MSREEAQPGGWQHMRALILGATMLLAAAQAGVSAKIHRCDTKSVNQLNWHDGSMGAVEPFGVSSSLVIDTENGAVSLKDGPVWYMHVAHVGDGSQATILAGDKKRPLGSVENFALITHYSWQDRPTFMLVVLQLVANGICDEVK